MKQKSNKKGKFKFGSKLVSLPVNVPEAHKEEATELIKGWREKYRVKYKEIKIIKK